MTKITFVNNSSPLLSAENLNAMQTNAENAIATAKTEAINESIIGANTYTTTETIIGKWIDNKPIYRKVMYISSLPDHNTVTYPTDTTNVDRAIHIYGIGHTSSGNHFPLPYVSMFSNNTENIELTWLGGNNMRVVTGSDRSGMSAYIVFEYTKTTD